MDKKIIKILIAVIAIVVIMISIVTIILIQTKSNTDGAEEIMGEDVDEEEYKIAKTNNVIEFEIARNLIQRYINYSEMNNTEAINQISENEIKFNLKKDGNTEFFINEMYGISLYSETRYFIKGETSADNEEYYIVLDVDFTNNTYRLQQITIDKYNEEINMEHTESNTKAISIEKNNYNENKEVGIDETYSLLSGYVNQYKSYLDKNLEKAYELLDDEYREKKFQNSYEKFVKYINNIKQELSYKEMMSYTKNSDGYEVEIGEEDSFIFKTNELGKYTILLDSYTIKTQDFIDKYNELSATNKVGTNIDKIFKMLNNKEYEQIYDCLSETYKANNFETYTKFENYIKEKFFNYNYVGELKVQEEQQYYLANIIYSDGIGSAAEYRKVSIIMRLDNDAEFTIAFANEE